MNADTGAIDWYYQYLPCDDWDQDFVQERTLIDTVVNPDPESVRWINPKLAGTAEERKVVVVLGEPGGLFVNDRETGEFLWADPFPFESTERFVISDVDVETGTTYINMDLVAREEGDQVHHLRPQREGLVVVVLQPGDRDALRPDQPLLPEPDDELPHGLGGQPAVHDSRSGHRSGRRPDGGAGASTSRPAARCGATASGPRTPARRWRRRGTWSSSATPTGASGPSTRRRARCSGRRSWAARSAAIR